MYRYGGTLQLNHIPGEGAKVPIWIPAVFDPALMVELNSTSKRVTGEEKYPTLHLSDRDTGERFGLEYTEPGCRPVPLDWDKHRTQKRGEPAALVPLPPVQTPTPAQAQAQPQPPDTAPSSSRTQLSDTASPGPASSIGHLHSAGEPPAVIEISHAKPAAIHTVQMLSQGSMGLPVKRETSNIPPLPLQSSPRSARTGPIKTGGRVFVLDHKRWTSPMKEAIDSLLDNYHGQKDMLKLVDQDYAAMVHRSATDPNSLLHPTTKYHIAQYMKQEFQASSFYGMEKERWAAERKK